MNRNPVSAKSDRCVSVVMPVFNEGPFIERTLRSVQDQKTPGLDLEILVIDGQSEDGTAEKISALAADDPRIKLLRNPLRHTPAAFNIGLRAASGDYVCIMGAHAFYDPNYISTSLQELLAHDAVGCSGKVITVPADNSLQARLIAWAAAHPVASSSRSVRTQPEGYADTVPFPVMRKQALLDLGGYNEKLLRNQDNDMNQRLRAAGFRLYVTGKTQCRYYARPRVTAFLRYAFKNGLWNALSLRQNPASLGLRHLAPLGFVCVILGLFAAQAISLAFNGTWLPGIVLAFILFSHLSVGLLAGLQTAFREKSAAALWLAPLILAFHCAYGLGTLRGLLASPESSTTVPLLRSSSN